MVESFPPSQQLSSPVFPPQSASGLVRATGWTPADLIGWLNQKSAEIETKARVRVASV
jgi:hypothetical protein